jgi:hypothetical protein
VTVRSAPAALALALAACLVLPAPAPADIAGRPAEAHALTGVNLIAAPGATPVAGTILLRDGRIERDVRRAA